MSDRDVMLLGACLGMAAFLYVGALTGYRHMGRLYALWVAVAGAGVLVAALTGGGLGR